MTGLRDPLVETPVQRLELARVDRRAQLDRQLRHGLTEIAVVLDDLRDREAHRVATLTVQCRIAVDLRTSILAERQRRDEFIEEERDSDLDLGARRLRRDA